MTTATFNNLPMTKNLDNLLSDLITNFPSALSNTWKESSLHYPQANVLETKDAYHLELNVPGRNKEDFKISVDKGELTIQFEQKEETKQTDYKTIRREFNFRSFKRSFQIDKSVNADTIEARYENGILKLILPKKEEVKEGNKQITVQ